MKVKFLTDEDFINYKKPSMFIGLPYCSFKCEKEHGANCQNHGLTTSQIFEVSAGALVSRYLKNPITTSIVLGGLEPFDSWEDLKEFLSILRFYTEDEVVIYTGYKEEEIPEILKYLSKVPNIIVKFGRFIPNQTPHYDELLGVFLVSPNQYAKKIS